MITIVELLPKGKCVGECECGAVKEFYTSNVKSGKSKSCGCLSRCKVPKEISRTFTLMTYRCNTITSPDYPRWGGNGITVGYKDMLEFYQDVGDKPSTKHSIDRIDNTLGYCKGNCRWATAKEQSNNTSSNVNVHCYDETKTIAEWADWAGIKYTTLKERLVRGWTIERALEQKVEVKYASRTK